MARIGIFCLPMRSHVNLFLALAHELRSRGHHLTFFGIPSNAKRVSKEGFTFEVLEPDSAPSGTLDRMMDEMSSLGNLSSMRLQGRFDELRYSGILAKAPAMVKQARLQALIVDQAEACSGSVADATGLPWISVCSGLCLNSEPRVPPFFTGWNYSDSRWAVTRNKLAYAGMRLASRSLRQLVNECRKKWGFPAHDSLDDTFSPFAQVSQQVREFDFPRRNLPDSFRYVGPIKLRNAPPVDFPWHRLDGRPLIYASLGTVANRHDRLYRIILQACAELDAQLVLSLGGSDTISDSSRFPNNPVIVNFAPQRQLLGRAAAAITHAGLNSTLEALSEGVPLVAIPITFEQPAIAARIRWTGSGDFIPSAKIGVDRLRKLLRGVLNESSYRESARAIGGALAASGGASAAADIFEQVMRRATACSDPAAKRPETESHFNAQTS